MRPYYLSMMVDDEKVVISERGRGPTDEKIMKYFEKKCLKGANV